MATLTRELRKTLEKVTAEAREVAEGAATKALTSLAVGDKEPHHSMSKEQGALRNRLRAHGRQLGDRRNVEKGTQETDHLIAECAYEHWHRMLFARFLAENQLLLEPESGVAIAIDEVKELARERNKDWVVLAGEFAVPMLPQVFRQGDPVLEVPFAPEDRKRLEELVESLSAQVFAATDSLGWCYQFWQSEEKDAINARGNKIGADELPAVTQLFTEDYMVDFLLDNTLGAWHAGKVLASNPQLAESAGGEEELRAALALRGAPWSYLRFIKGEDGKWSPAAGSFDGWPKAAKDLKCLDPCMGSGHFVVAMFERLVALRVAEGLNEPTAVAAVIRDNLFGLEIDPRCTQIGAFNLGLAAWRRVGHCALPAMNLACSGLAPNAQESDWLALAGKNEKLQNGMSRLYRLFKDAPVLGSLINPHAGEGDLLVAAFHELQPLLEKALAQETKNDTAHEMAVTARGLAKAAAMLASQFTLIATNVPYLGRGKQEDVLTAYCERVHPEAKADLATCFVERSLVFCSSGGSAALVTPQNWLFLGPYKKLRKRALASVSWCFVARLGTGAFGTIGGEVVNVALLGVTRIPPEGSHAFVGLDASAGDTLQGKAERLGKSEFAYLSQKDQLTNPDSIVTLTAASGNPLLGMFANTYAGVCTGDYPRFGRCFWEVCRFGEIWEFQCSTVKGADFWKGREGILRWENGRGELYDFVSDRLGEKNVGSWLRGKECWGNRGLGISLMTSLPVSIYTGELFDDNLSVLIPKKPEQLPAILAFCSSPDFHREVRRINQKMALKTQYLVKVPFDLARWQKIADEEYPHGLPGPFSSDPTQWLFNGHPTGADQPLQVAVARLLGYQWPRLTGSSFPDCPALGPDVLKELVDDDGIVPISPVKGEGPAAERLRELLARAYGKDWNAARQEGLLGQVECAGGSLDDWLRKGFFEQHCALFHHRPFIWHIWDGLVDGFQALVNYHKLAAPDGEGRRTLEKLAFSYLGDWITRQKADQKTGKEGADAKLAAALHLQGQLKAILEGEPPYDLFVRWKPMHEQAIGWEPDINDGVRMNIRPFMMAETLNRKSIFRKEPKIKWAKDRGKEPERPKRDFPWFWSWDEEAADFKGGREFDGNRYNDLHYSNDVKEAARAEKKEKKR